MFGNAGWVGAGCSSSSRKSVYLAKYVCIQRKIHIGAQGQHVQFFWIPQISSSKLDNERHSHRIAPSITGPHGVG